MRYSRCLRLACRHPVSPSCQVLHCPRPAARNVTLVGPHHKVPGLVSIRSSSSSAPPAPTGESRFTDEPTEEHEHVSSFKQHRLKEFREDQESQDPLYPDLYPRLESSEERQTTSEFLKGFKDGVPEENVILTGRVRSKRVAGKALVFLDIVNEFQRVQVMLNKKKCISGKHKSAMKFALFRNLIEVGDHISVTGTATRTDAGEPTLEATELPELLAPAMEQIPDQLTDAKTRMQERHVDMLVNPQVLHTLRLRAEITKFMRDHFHSKRFLEFQTPILAENAGGAVARPFVTKATEFRNRDLALRIAPELWLKRLVVGGVDRVFEIGPAFRNEGVDATHNPEFTMCEFYSAYTNLPDLIRETEELLCGLAKHCQEAISTQLTALPPIDLSRFARPFKQVEFVPALEAAMGIRFPKLSAEGALAELLVQLKLAGIHVPGETPSSLPKLLDRLAAMYLEPQSFTEPVFIVNHPACMSPLAKSFLCPKTYQLVSARAELFVGGRELANMYEEENSPDEQRRKLLAHRSLVNKDDGGIGFDAQPEQSSEDAERPAEEDEWAANPLDQSYVKALEYGLPPTGGWGCGVERLVMLFSGANRISDCLSFGTLRNVVGLSAEERAAEKVSPPDAKEEDSSEKSDS
ncbi:hypothetical protein HIM_09065 [Hirsutella minnesotensis 3608]|uniref:Lysyl-tRNA synthetase n=1 Tax=Hirsutella minnesotensis 3608 TaxID=1043627 RepID=A0A0F7ZXY4_9HYPO|nr:hypothetical protein HIM_09065 [Hirsutella minnesotensis 3608]